MSMVKTFSPLKDLASHPSRRPANLTEVNLRALTPFQRALLVIDGTVTKFIEVSRLEPVEIVQLKHERTSLAANDEWLAAEAGADVVSRQVSIRGELSRALFVWARSLIAADRLPATIATALQTEGAGLGRLLNEARLETRREILWFGRGTPTGLPSSIQESAGDDFLSRTYRILFAGKPIALIEENFPASTSRLPSHV